MNLNNEQQAAVFCAENAVVSAGAGSGKTTVLAGRFVWLLTEKNYKVDEILTLTFTKKAASEMYKRIYSLIAEIAEKETGIKAQRAKDALRDFIKARIQTLDSYSASIVKQSAPRYGLSPDFQIDPDRCKELALQVSYPYLLTHRNHPSIERLYAQHRPNDIVHNIFSEILFNYSLIGKPVDFFKNTKNQFDIICAEWDNSISRVNELIKEIDANIQENENFLPEINPIIAKYPGIKSDIPDANEIREYLELLNTLPENTCIEQAENHQIQKKFLSFVFYLHKIAGINLQKGKKFDNPVKENVKLIREEIQVVLSLAISCAQAGITISILPLLTELQEKYILQKRAEGVLTFSDVANLARTVLLEHKDIRKSEKESFKAIMIDEFQDNNDLQKELLFLLAEKQDILGDDIPSSDDLDKGKLFFVGDEKQSIYLFRGADVSVFRRLKDEIKPDKAISKTASAQLSLKVNYRSSPKLISAFNAIMPLFFAPDKNLPLYEAGFSPLEAYHDFDGKLALCVHNSTENTEDNCGDAGIPDNENEARFIAKKIRGFLDENKYKPNDIALLLRTRSNQHIYEKHLRLLDIPYSSENIGNLFYGGPVNDIMSVLRLAAYPLDSASYAEMLRSPFAGLSLPGTALCLSLYLDEENPVPFDDKPLEVLDSNDKNKYLNGKKIYMSILEKSKESPVSELVSELWHNKGYRYETEWNPEVRVYGEMYDYLYHLAAISDLNNQGLAAFTDLIQSYRDDGKQLTDIDIPLERSGAVHLMTIHKSKGLEFPVVFLCGCGKKSRSDSCSAVYYSENTGIALSLPVPESYRFIPNMLSNFFWHLGNEERLRKETAELRRLLYVGMTRAEKELYITGSLKIKEPEEDSEPAGGSDAAEDFFQLLKNHITVSCEERWKNQPNAIEGDNILDNDTFFGLLLPAITSFEPGSYFDFEEIPSYSEEQIKSAQKPHDVNEYIQKIDNLLKKAKIIKTPFIPKNHRSPVSLRSENNKDDEDTLLNGGFSVNEEFCGENSFDVFIKADAVIEKHSQFNPAAFGSIAHICVEAELKGIEPHIPADITGSLPPADMEILLEAGKETASRFARSPLGLIAKKAPIRENEFPFRTLIKDNDRDVFINGTIDLFFEDGNTIHIVDFKTDSREKAAEHTAQMACYLRAICELFAEKKCRIWLYYLRTGHSVEMTEEAENFNLEQCAFSL